MKARRFLFGLIAAVLLSAAAAAGPVLMISLDGLKPADVLQAKQRGLNLPNLTLLVKQGAYASGVRVSLPSLTYPNHTTLVTGVWPAQHGIFNNAIFDPTGVNMQAWYWYASDIQVPTLWDAVHGKGGKVASLGWPVSVGSRAIDFDVPEYWRAQTAEDLKLLRVLATPGLVARLEHDTGLPLGALFGEDPEHDAARTRYAEDIYGTVSPEFMTVHLVSLDHLQHAHGPGSPEAHAALERLDADVGELVAAARRTRPDVTVAIVSDHGFAAVSKQVNLASAFVEAGLVTLKNGKVAAWDAIPWEAGGSAMIVLARPEDQVLKDKVAAFLAKLAADPANGIAKAIDRAGIAARGGAGAASFWVDFMPGYFAGRGLTGPLVAPSSLKGTHGYFPEDPEMRATFIIAGPGIPKKKLGEIDMRDIAPTLAKIMDVPFPSAAGKPLF